MNIIKDSKLIIVYIAGFLDADGCINAQIVHRKDYNYGYQIRIYMSFSQKSNRHWFIIWLHEYLKTGVIRERKDYMSEYVITGKKNIHSILSSIVPYLIIKKPQALLLLEIIEDLDNMKNYLDFLKICKKVDKFAFLNDSKKRKINYLVVKEYLDLKFPRRD